MYSSLQSSLQSKRTACIQCVRVPKVPFLEAKACNFIKKETLAQVLSCEFGKVFKNTLFTELLRATPSALHFLGRLKNEI